MKTSDIKPYTIRLEPSLREKLDKAAFENSRSLQQEVIHRLEQSFMADEHKIGEAFSDEGYKSMMKSVAAVVADQMESWVISKAASEGVSKEAIYDKIFALEKERDNPPEDTEK